MARLGQSIGKKALLYTAAAIFAVGGLARCGGEEMESCYTNNSANDFCNTYSHGIEHEGCRDDEYCKWEKPKDAPESECEGHCEPYNDYSYDKGY